MLLYCIGLPLTYDQNAGGLSEVSLQLNCIEDDGGNDNGYSNHSQSIAKNGEAQCLWSPGSSVPDGSPGGPSGYESITGTDADSLRGQRALSPMWACGHHRIDV